MKKYFPLFNNARNLKSKDKSNINLDFNFNYICPLYNKTWNCLGDSITNGFGVEKQYHYWIKNKYNMSVNNYGISNTTFTNVKDYFYPIIQDNSADYITVWAGINDFKASALLGVITDRTRNTFYGALHIVCRDLLTNYPSAKIGFITPMKCEFEGYTEFNTKNNHNLELELYVNAIKQVCSYYSIPVLDMFSECNISPYIQNQKQLYLSDGLHPNEEGHKRLSNKIEKFLFTL